MTNLKGTITRKELKMICEGIFDVKSVRESYEYIRANWDGDGANWFDVYVRIQGGKMSVEMNQAEPEKYNGYAYLFRTYGNETFKEFVLRAEIIYRGYLKNPD